MKKNLEQNPSFGEYVKKNRVFILGAGFSAKAGVPLTSSLLQLAMRKFSMECEGIFQRVDRYARESIGCYGDNDLDYGLIDFSDLCTFLEFIELREYGGGERWTSQGSREKLALRYYLAKTIAEHTPSQGNIPQLYLDFASQLHEGDIVISLNWDGLLEIALMAVGKSFTYNWSDDNAIKLCKLHGSINWRLSEPNDLGKPVNTLGWRAMEFTEGMMDVDIYHTPKLLEYRTWKHNSPLGEIEPFLVLPGYGKAFDVRSNAVLWYKPEVAFATTHDVYIVGLSLAPDDFFIRSLFLSNLPYIRSFTGVEGRRIFVINPDKRAEENYQFILSRGDTELISEKFSSEHLKLMAERVSKA